MKVFTIGFTRKSAAEFFTLLQDAGVQRVVDIRISNTSQLAGFTKKDDLEFFLKEIAGIAYVHLPELGPTEALMNGYKKGTTDWKTFARQFLKLMKDRRVDKTVDRELLRDGCLLCSERNAGECHRSLVVEYLQRQWGDLDVVHL